VPFQSFKYSRLWKKFIPLAQTVENHPLISGIFALIFRLQPRLKSWSGGASHVVDTNPRLFPFRPFTISYLLYPCFTHFLPYSTSPLKFSKEVWGSTSFPHSPAKNESGKSLMGPNTLDPRDL